MIFNGFSQKSKQSKTAKSINSSERLSEDDGGNPVRLIQN